MPPATRADVATLEFDPAQATIDGDVDVRQGLSAVVLHEGDLWVACDEGCRLERLTRSGSDASQFGQHTVFELERVLDLPGSPKEEADIEGLDVDDKWLWLVGSHSVKRNRPKERDTSSEGAVRLAKTERDGNRHLLARVPLRDHEPVRKTSQRRAGSLANSKKSSALLEAILECEDPHLGPFVPIPGKDNGFDVEGLAVRGMRAFVGLRGPVLREWCCILELLMEADADDGSLTLLPLDGAVPYRKHFLKLGGLGVRDLVWVENDLLILAGPPMAHDGPIEIWRWKNATKQRASGTASETRRLLVLPHGERTDRAEGMTIFDGDAAGRSVLIVFDTPDARRLTGVAAVHADIYRLP